MRAPPPGSPADTRAATGIIEAMSARPIWFDEGMERALLVHSEIEQGIRYGLDHGQFIPYFEPQVDLLTGEIIGFEVLARLLEVPRENIFASGDHHNDISMLDGKVAAMPSCPANAIQEVQDAVRNAGGYVAQKNHGSGVHEALLHFAKRR